MRTRWLLVRDILLFVVGLGGVANEALIQEAERPTLLLLYAAMLGLPAFLRSDERNKDDDGSGGGRA